jgi:hypothetical protein
MADVVEQDLFAGDEVDPYDPLDVKRAETKTLSLQEASEMTVFQRLERRAQAYRRMYGNLAAEDREIIEADLEMFCRGNRAVFHENERVHVLLTGRQEVWMRIQDHVRLDLEELVRKYTQPLQQE